MSRRVQRVLDLLTEPGRESRSLKSVGQMLDLLTMQERRDLAARLNARYVTAHLESDRLIARLAKQLNPSQRNP